jgi:S1-C subfamily serine protease
MDNYRKSLLLTLVLAVISCTFTLYLFFLPEENETAVLGIQNTKATLSEHSWDKFEFDEKEVEYNSDLLKIDTSNEEFLILPKNWKLFQYAQIGKLEFKENFITTLESKKIYPDLQLITSEDKDSYQVYLFTFQQPYIFQKEGFRTVYLTIYTTKDSIDNRYYIEVRGLNYLRNSKIDDSFVEIVRSLNGTVANNVLGTSSSQANIGKVLGQSATVKIFAKNCYDVSFSNDFAATFAGKSYEICGAGTGSGFLINSTGEILTNAHVAKPNRFDTVINGISTDGQYEQDMATDLIGMLYSSMGEYATFLSQDQLQTLYVYLLSEMYKEDYVKITGGITELYVQGTDNFDIDVENQELSNKEVHKAATLVRGNDISSVYEAILASVDEDELLEDNLEDVMNSSSLQEGLTGTSDLALIRLNSTPQIPSLLLSETDPVQGEDIYVIGYPGVNEDTMLTSNEGQTNSTITQGSITGIKPNTTNTYDLLQMDASVEAGNSGGPIVNDSGEVLGMTTYSYASTSGNFNWGISSTELKNFVNQSGSVNKANETNIVLSSALSDISKDYYSRSKEKLEGLVKGENTLAIVLNPLVTLCDTNIAQGNDKSPWFDLGFIDIPNWGFILIGGILVVMIVLIIILVSLSKRKSSKGFPKTDYENLPKTDTQTPPPTTPTATVQQTQPQVTQQPQQDDQNYLRPQNQSLQHVRNVQTQANVTQQEGNTPQPIANQTPTQPTTY